MSLVVSALIAARSVITRILTVVIVVNIGAVKRSSHWLPDKLFGGVLATAMVAIKLVAVCEDLKPRELRMRWQLFDWPYKAKQA